MQHDAVGAVGSVPLSAMGTHAPLPLYSTGTAPALSLGSGYPVRALVALGFLVQVQHSRAVKYRRDSNYRQRHDVAHCPSQCVVHSRTLPAVPCFLRRKLSYGTKFH
jgi:hypothetical protein